MNLRKVEDQAKEELQSLEAKHPNHHLKADLESFIILLQSNHPSLPLLDNKSISIPTSSSATTQASCSGNKRKKSGIEVAWRHKMQKTVKGKKDRVDVVLERARACLKKIQQVKSRLVF